MKKLARRNAGAFEDALWSIGAVMAGAGLGMLVGRGTSKDCTADTQSLGCGVAGLTGGLIGLGAVTAGGLLLGATSKNWEHVGYQTAGIGGGTLATLFLIGLINRK